jgi:hypothetical protein
MAARTTIDVLGLNRVKAKVKTLADAVTSPDKALLVEIGEFMRFSIQKRTAEGKDVSGKKFESYTPEYAAFRDITGHPSEKVNLFFTGSMMSSMDFDTDRGKVELFFQNTNDPSGTSNPLKAFFLNEKRTFFSLSEDDVRSISNMVEKYYNKIIRR